MHQPLASLDPEIQETQAPEQAHRQEGEVLAQRVEDAADELGQLVAHRLEGVAGGRVEDVARRAHVLAKAHHADHVEGLALHGGAGTPAFKTGLCNMEGWAKTGLWLQKRVSLLLQGLAKHYLHSMHA